MLMQIDLTNRLSGRGANITKCERRSVLSCLLPLNSDIMFDEKGRNMESIVLYLIRHGVTNFNEEGRVQGESDSYLTEKGQRDVLKVCEKLKDNAIDKNSYKLISSPLLRTVESSTIISNCFGLDIVEDNRLVELKRGVIEGKTKNEFSENDLENINAFKKNPWSERVPGGESFTDLKIRIDDFLEGIRKSSSNLIMLYR